MAANAIERRDEILDRLADHLLAQGLAATSLRRLGEAAQVSDRMLQYYFRDKAEVIDATFARVSGRLLATLDERTPARAQPFGRLLPELQTLMLAEEIWPYMRLWLEVAALSARDDPVYRGPGARITRDFIDWGASRLDGDTTQERESDAARLYVLLKGMVLLKSLGMGDVCASVAAAAPDAARMAS